MDQFNYALSGLGDQTMRMVVGFEGRLDEKRLEDALARVLAQIPVLNSRFVETGAPYWEHLGDARRQNKVQVMYAETGDRAPDLFLGTPVDPAAGPQIRLRVLRTPHGDTLCIAVHHAAMDARGLLACTRLLADYYREPGRPDCPNNAAGDRSLTPVLALFPEACGVPGAAPEKSPVGWAFPGTTGKEVTRVFSLRTLPGERLDAIKNAGHQQGATVTDVILAAYFRALCTEIRPDPGTRLPIMVSIDLRRYLACTGRESPATLVSNQSVAFPVVMVPETGSFGEAIVQAHAAMQVNMAHNPGISSAADLEQFGYQGFAKIQKRVQETKAEYADRHANTPFLANIGIIPGDTVAFSPDLPVADAYLAGIVLDPPGVALGVTTFKGRLTLIAGYGTPGVSRVAIERLMDRIVSCLPGKGDGQS